MNERIFRTELTRGLSSCGHVIPIPDSGAAARFGVKKVYDLGWLSEGMYFGFELKQIRNGVSMGWSQVEPHQMTGMRNCLEAGGYPYLIVNYRRKSVPGRTAIKYGIKPGRLNQTWAVKFKDFEKFYVMKRNVDLAWFMEFGIELPLKHVDKKIAWDPSPLLGGVS